MSSQMASSRERRFCPPKMQVGCRDVAACSVIASAAKQSRVFPRRDSGLLRCARNDGVEAVALDRRGGEDQTGTSRDHALIQVFCPTEQIVSAEPKFLKPFNPMSTVHGVVSRFFSGRAYPAPARFFCQTRCTAQVQPGGCEARSFDVSSFAGVAAKVLSAVCCEGM